MLVQESAAEDITMKADRALYQAEVAIDDAHPNEARAHIDRARTFLQSREMDRYPERHILRHELTKLEARLPGARKQAAEIQLKERLSVQEQSLTESLVALRLAKKQAKKAKLNVSRDEIAQLTQSIGSLRTVLKKGRTLEVDDKKYRKRARAVSRLVESADRVLVRAEKIADIREGPLALAKEARSLRRTAKNLEPKEQREALLGAEEKYEGCRTSAARLREVSPPLGETQFSLHGKAVSLAELRRACTRGKRKTRKLVRKATLDARRQEAKLRRAEARSAFVESAVVSYKEGRRHLALAKQGTTEERVNAFSQASDRFRQCAQEGQALMQKYARLKKRKFVLTKSKKTAEGVVSLCRRLWKRAKKGLVRQETRLANKDRIAELRKGPLRDFRAAKTLLSEARKSGDKQKQDRYFKRSRKLFKGCASSLSAFLLEAPTLAKAKVKVGNKRRTLGWLRRACRKAAKREQALALAKGAVSRSVDPFEAE